MPVTPKTTLTPAGLGAPTPWIANSLGFVLDATGRAVNSSIDRRPNQAEVTAYVLRAVNMHEDLVDALKWARSQLRCVPHLDDPDCPACSGRNPVDKVLALAGGAA